jgi:hypothetical protein
MSSIVAPVLGGEEFLPQMNGALRVVIYCFFTLVRSHTPP